MNNKVTVFEFVTEFNNFYNNVLELVEEGYANEKMPRHYVDNVYDRIDGLKTEIERTLESKVLSVDKAGIELCKIVQKFVRVAENCFENYELTNHVSLLEAHKFYASVVDTYNDLCEELGYN